MAAPTSEAPTTDAPTTDETPTTRELLADIGSREPGHHHDRPVEVARGERRFVRWLLITVAVAIVAIVAALWWLDPISVTGRQTRFSVVENGGVRQAKLDLMEDLPAPPEVMILGSSRSMKIDPTDITALTKQSAFNGGVSGGTSKDIYLYARYADQLWGSDGQFPHLVIGVVNDVFRDHGTAGFDPRLRRFLPSAEKTTPKQEIVTELLQWKTLQSAARVVPKVVKRDGWGSLLQPVQTSGALRADLAVEGKQESNKKKNFAADGLQLFDPVKSLKVPLKKRIDGQMRTYVTNTYTNDEAFTGIDPAALVRMRRTITLANRLGDVPTIWVTPYQPQAATNYLPTDQYQARNKVFLDAMQQLEDDPSLDFHFVQETEDIASFGGNPNDFYDGIHMKPANTRRVMEYLSSKGLLARAVPTNTTG